MDRHGKKEENNSQYSASAADHHREETAAAAEGEDTSEESMDQSEAYTYKADESTGLLVEDDVVGSEEASGHPWPLLGAFAGCLGLHGCCGGQKPPPPAATEAATAAPAATSQEEDAGVEKAAKANAPPQGFYMQEVISRVWAVAVRPRPPDHAKEGSGGNGGVHH